MEDRRAIQISISVILLLIISIIIARIYLKLSETFFLICGAAIAAIFSVLTIVIIRIRYRSRRKQLERQLDFQGRELRIEYSFLRKVAGVPIKFRHRELEEATDGFRTLLGRGGSGAVYKGILTDGTPAAVKRIDGEEQGEKLFKSEVAALASVQHVNLVRLLGYCIASAGPRFLVYEFVYNGSLDKWIFPKLRTTAAAAGRQRDSFLPWASRCRVALDVAKALSYLHHDCRSCILHLDVKPENILIDENYRALVSDFGLSKLKGREESRVVTSIRGTRGYLAPEWILENGISEKCDVYGYGMVLLEIIGGRRSICALEKGHNSSSKKKFQYFPQIVVEKMREGKLMEIVDDRVLEDGGVDEREVRRMVAVALWCIQEKAKMRPSMKRVVEMLEGRVPVGDPPETQMLVVDLLSIDDEDETENVKRKKANTRQPRFVQLDRENPTSSAYSFAYSTLYGR